MDVTSFDHLETGDAADVVRVWADIPSWIDALVGSRPYGSVAALEAAALAGARRWGSTDLEAALAHHPRIGARVIGGSAEAAASRTEQASMAGAAADLAAEIAAGNVEYEQKFGRVFLIRAAGRSPQEMAAELRRRLANSPLIETREALEQLAEIALLRLRATVTEGAPQ